MMNTFGQGSAVFNNKTMACCAACIAVRIDTPLKLVVLFVGNGVVLSVDNI